MKPVPPLTDARRTRVSSRLPLVLTGQLTSSAAAVVASLSIPKLATLQYTKECPSSVSLNNLIVFSVVVARHTHTD